MSKDNKKGWYFLFAVAVAVVIFIGFSTYINHSTLDENLNQAMKEKGTNMISYRLYSKTKSILGADPIYLVKGANGKQYQIEVDHNHLVVSTIQVN